MGRPHRVFQGALVFMISLIIGVTIAITIGPANDMFLQEMNSMGLFDDPNANDNIPWAKWDPTESVLYQNNLMYLCMYIIPCFGFVVFLITIVEREPEDYEQYQYRYE